MIFSATFADMKNADYLVIVPSNVYPKPSDKELSTAYILAEYFQTNIKFIPRANIKTPDFSIDGINWELKTPTGKGKYNLQHALKNAIKQSENIIIDARFSKIHINKIKSELKIQFEKSSNIKRLILIDKQKKILIFSK